MLLGTSCWCWNGIGETEPPQSVSVLGKVPDMALRYWVILPAWEAGGRRGHWEVLEVVPTFGFGDASNESLLVFF